jgi:Pyridine nucleotide-disulphide oxidoreductase.
MYDIAVIGGGPAGLSAAVNAKIRNKDVIVFTGKNPTSPLLKAPSVDNYLGCPSITGEELLKKYKDHALKLRIPEYPDKVINIFKTSDYFVINANNNFIDALSVIIATGIPRNRYIPGEKKYLGKGVSYCATCDGPLYKNKTVAVISEDNEGEEEANFLSELAEMVYYIPLYKSIYSLNNNVKIISDKPVKITGDDIQVQTLQLKNQSIDIDGIFLIKKVTPITELIPGLEMDGGTIKVDRMMSTNIPGVFAAGDCTGAPYQVAKAVGEGLVAGLSAARYVDTVKRKWFSHFLFI